MDQFTKVTQKGFGSRIVNSITGILFGIILFLGSFVLLYWNEGRVDLSKVAATAIDISATAQNPEADGKLVSVNEKVSSGEVVGDSLYLKPGDYLAVNRDAEMYAWVEHEETKTEKNIGGSETETTTYTYDTKWTSNPEDSSNFEHPEGHQNPLPMKTESETFRVNSAKLGIYSLDMQSIDLPGSEDLALKQDMITLTPEVTLSGNYIYRPASGVFAEGKTEVGDIRISYSVVPDNGSVTVFGKLNGDKIEKFIEKKAELYRMFTGSRDESIATLATEHKIITWVLRLLGFILMWVGLSMLFEPISVFLDVLPALGSVSRFAIKSVTFLVALVLSITTILVSMILHNIYAVIAAAVIVGVLVYMWMKGRKKTAKTA
jgi:hypothetical protein